jgi:hypothetical protein
VAGTGVPGGVQGLRALGAGLITRGVVCLLFSKASVIGGEAMMWLALAYQVGIRVLGHWGLGG